jgi:hypothetical protein
MSFKTGRAELVVIVGAAQQQNLGSTSVVQIAGAKAIGGSA